MEPANELPNGLYYEKARRRYRVRLYKNGEVIHRSYHRCYNRAVDTLCKAREAAERFVPTATKPKAPTLDNLLHSLLPTTPPSLTS